MSETVGELEAVVGLPVRLVAAGEGGSAPLSGRE